jgi:hypothetical protein
MVLKVVNIGTISVPAFTSSFSQIFRVYQGLLTLLELTFSGRQVVDIESISLTFPRILNSKVKDLLMKISVCVWV